MGAGDSRQRSDLLAGLPLISKTKRECPVGTPSFVLSGGIAARGKGLPSVSRLRAGRVPPAPAACGPLTLPTLCGGGAAARPACLRQSGKCGGWSPPVGGSGQASRQPLRGATQSGRKAKPLRGRFAGLAPGQPRAGCGVGAPGRPGPHDVGAVGPSAPPARSAALRPALPARPRLRRRPCRAALPTHSPPGVAALPGSRWPTSGPRQAARQALAPLRAACSLPACAGRSARAAAAGRNLDRRAHWRRKRRLPRASRAAGRRGTPPTGGSAGRFPGRQGQGKPRAGRQEPPTSGGLACRCPGQRGQNVAGVPPSGGFPPLSHSGKRWCCYVCCCLSYLCFWPGLVAGLPVWWCLWLVAVPACSVALALCSGGGFCLSVCSGICAGLFLACWCAGRSAGGGSVQIKIPHRVTSPVGDFPANIRRCRPQKTARQKATAHGL